MLRRASEGIQGAAAVVGGREVGGGPAVGGGRVLGRAGIAQVVVQREAARIVARDLEAVETGAGSEEVLPGKAACCLRSRSGAASGVVGF